MAVSCEEEEEQDTLQSLVLLLLRLLLLLLLLYFYMFVLLKYFEEATAGINEFLDFFIFMKMKESWSGGGGSRVDPAIKENDDADDVTTALYIYLILCLFVIVIHSNRQTTQNSYILIHSFIFLIYSTLSSSHLNLT